jgi:MFS family permease
LRQVFLFATFNAFSFQIVLGGPMVLYAKSLGASATVLGIIAGMMPLLVIFQIPAARYVAAVGYKRFVLRGWTVRVTFIFMMSLVPMTEWFLQPGTRLSLMLFLLFWFNLSRGISSCGWLPWITSLIPAEIRGRYLAREAACVNVASGVTLLVAALLLGGEPGGWRFSAIFIFSAVSGAVSLWFLRRIPEGETPGQMKFSNTAVPWREIARYEPFRKLLRMNVAWALAFGGMSAFTVTYLKVEAALPERTILLLASTSFVGGLASLWLLSSRLDRFGSRPVLMAACLGWLMILCAWVLLSARVIDLHLAVVMILMFLMGLGAAVVSMANTRLAMAVVPTMGRSHFFALFSVVGNLALGVAPIFWGLVIDAFRPFETVWHGLHLNRYTVFFLGGAVAFSVAWWYSRQLEEPAAGSMEDLLGDILQRSRFRFWLRLWPRQ